MKHVRYWENIQLSQARAKIDIRRGWIADELMVDHGFSEAMQHLKAGGMYRQTGSRWAAATRQNELEFEEDRSLEYFSLAMGLEATKIWWCCPLH